MVAPEQLTQADVVAPGSAWTCKRCEVEGVGPDALYRHLRHEPLSWRDHSSTDFVFLDPEVKS